MEIETPRVYESLQKKGWIHRRVWSSQGSYLAATTVERLFGQDPNRLNYCDLALQLIECNHAESGISCKDKAHYTNHADWYWGEHRQQHDKDTPRSLLRSTKETDGTTTTWGAQRSQIQGSNKRVWNWKSWSSRNDEVWKDKKTKRLKANRKTDKAENRLEIHNVEGPVIRKSWWLKGWKPIRQLADSTVVDPATS